MAGNVWSYIKSTWQFMVSALAPIAIVAIIFALPLKTVPVVATETYYETEIVNQPYIISEAYTELEPYTTTEPRTETVYDSYIYPGNWSHTFKVDKADSTVSVDYHGYTDYPRCYVIYSGDEDSSYSFWPYNYWGGQSRVTIKVTYPEETTKYNTITKYRDVTKYREVPTQVQKEKTVTEYMKMSIWAYLFK